MGLLSCGVASPLIAVELRGRVAVDPVGDGARAGVQDQRRDHRLDAEDRDQRAVEKLEEDRREAAEQESDDHTRGRDAAHALEHLDEDGARDRADRADGDVLAAAGRRHERHAHRDDGQLARAVDDADEVAGQHDVAAVVHAHDDGEKADVAEEVEHDQDAQRDQRDQQLAETAGGFVLLFHLTPHLPRWSS